MIHGSYNPKTHHIQVTLKGAAQVSSLLALPLHPPHHHRWPEQPGDAKLGVKTNSSSSKFLFFRKKTNHLDCINRYRWIHMVCIIYLIYIYILDYLATHHAWPQLTNIRTNFDWNCSASLMEVTSKHV